MGKARRTNGSLARSELLGLLRACKQQTDDGLRLLLADWLEGSKEATVTSLLHSLPSRADRMTWN